MSDILKAESCIKFVISRGGRAGPGVIFIYFPFSKLISLLSFMSYLQVEKGSQK